MKNSSPHPVLFATVLFCVLIAGFFIGRLTLLRGNSLDYAPTKDQEVILTQAPKQPGLININTADTEDLMLLPGIGATLASRIIEYRTANGPFSSIEDLIQVKGIGAETLSKLKQFITVGG
jgi:comEA protein